MFPLFLMIAFLNTFMIVLKQHLFFSNNLRLLLATASDCSRWTSQHLDTRSGHPSERELGNLSLSALESSTLFPHEICVWIRKNVIMAQNLGTEGTIDLDKVPETECNNATAESTNHWDMNGQELCWWANALRQLVRQSRWSRKHGMSLKIVLNPGSFLLTDWLFVWNLQGVPDFEILSSYPHSGKNTLEELRASKYHGNHFHKRNLLSTKENRLLKKPQTNF